MKACLVCGAERTEAMIDFGPQPVSSHFLAAADSEAARRHLGLAVCRVCGIVQLPEPFPYEMLVPPFDWITYREPEDHLDTVVARACALAGVGPHSVVGGISYKDHTTLERFRRRGFERVWLIDPHDDLGATDPNANIETVHGRLDTDRAAQIAVRKPPADILVVRHIAEHAAKPDRFLDALEVLLAPGGYVVIEVPDCERNLSLRDYAMIWEEHSLYFTEDTLPYLLAGRGFDALVVDRYSYPFEDVLVLCAQRAGAEAAHVARVAPDENRVAASVELAAGYAADFPNQTQAIRETLDRLSRKGPIALYGAGHLSSTFVNLHNLAPYFAFVVDDTPEKQGLFLPGSQLEIVPRERLMESDVATCLFGLAPEIEDKVIANNQAFTARGGSFYSIFAASQRSIRNL